jgi:hypothetical protein
MRQIEEEEEDTDPERWLRDTGLTCPYDDDVIEYTDAVIAILVVKPYTDPIDGGLKFYDLPTEDNSDYLYEPVLFHCRNWEEVEEKLVKFLQDRRPVPVQNPLLTCKFCQSGILAGETMGIATLGEILRSQRNPDLKSYGNHFENLDRNPAFICISCLMDLNKEVHELWPDGVCHGEECETGTYARCWRSGCPGNCPQKK